MLKAGGTLTIWDCDIDSAYPEPFLADVDVEIGGQIHHTTYGVVKLDSQSRASIAALCARAGLRPIHESAQAGHFCLRYEKR